MNGFELHPRLRADTLIAGQRNGCLVLLMNDHRWPWLILVPQLGGLEELHDLDPASGASLFELVRESGAALKELTGCTKINTGALGNMVRQLHVHVIARKQGDANWPGPVWGHGSGESWPTDEAHAFIGQLCKALALKAA
ncbi:MAG: HIT family protein [Rhizobiaceae bacterium]